MSNYSEPDWVNASNAAATTTEDANTGGNITAAAAPTTTSRAASGGGGKGGLLLMCLSGLGIGLAVMMAALGVLTIIEVKESGVGDLSEPFLAAYMVMFAILLFMYELLWWTPLPSVNKAMRKNFGFMYGLRGKGAYLIFVACLCFGLGKDASVKQLNWATGVAFMAGGCLHWFIVCFHPDLADKYIAPTAGLADMSSQDLGDNVV
eukprot:Nitzschia sp. Nitz4//scaffold117_size69655//59791//60492//NITZ4_006029-RA/size69655-augustus-gene-0.3-mRNA-1//1//CDS//3329533666//8179//frame0